MRILLTNDDGLDSEGLRSLKDELIKLGEVTIAAPAGQKSAVSHAISLYQPLVVKKFEKDGVKYFEVDGTPADCVKLTILRLLNKTPDLVVSGINRGLNTGSNILYSGTVASALEASMFKITSCAVSLDDSPDADFKKAAKIALPIIEKISKLSKKSDIIFNINIPNTKIKGVKITRQEIIPYQDSYDKRIDPRGRIYYWLEGNPEKKMLKAIYKNRVGPIYSDALAVNLGYVSITPLKRDLTSYNAIGDLAKLF